MTTEQVTQAGLLFDFHCITIGAIFPAGDAEQDVSYCAAQKGLLFDHQTTNPQRLDNKSMIYPHLSHIIITSIGCRHSPTCMAKG